MSRILPVSHRLLTYSAQRLPQQPPCLVLPRPCKPFLGLPRRLHTTPSQDAKPLPRRRKLPILTTASAALAIALLTYALYSSNSTSTSSPSSPTPAPEHAILDTRRFTPYTIAAKDRLSSTSAIYVLRPNISPSRSAVADPYAELWKRGVWSVEFKQPLLQIARAYSPLPPLDGCRDGGGDGDAHVPGDLRFFIRREWRGEVSGYLDRLRVGAVVEVRGPRVEFEVPEGVEEMCFLAGGTGIVPALQVVYCLLEGRMEERESGSGGPNVRILWANRRREDCAGAPRVEKKRGWGWGLWSAPEAEPSEQPNRIVHQLQEMEKKYEGRVKVEYRIDEEGSFIGRSDILKFTSCGSASDSIANSTRLGKKLLLISGPEGFIEHYAGPREIEDGKQGQGCVGGVLGELKLEDWTVVKL